MKRSVVRRLLDLTPLLDVIMILLFGTMINSVEITKASNEKSRAEFAKLALSPEQIEALQAEVEEARARQKSLARRLEVENAQLKETFARLVGLDEKQRLSLEERTRRLAEATPEEAAKLLAEMKNETSAADLLLGLKRIEEMQKVFTFVDLHIDAANFLSLTSDGKPHARFSVRDANAIFIEAEIRRSLEILSLNEVVLFLFSYDGDARDRVVERTEKAVAEVIAKLRADPAQKGRQYRLGRVGLLADQNSSAKGTP